MKMDKLFMLYAQACEGELTATKEQLDKISLCLANTYLLDSANPNDPRVYKRICKAYGVDFDSLADEEIEYIERKTEEFIKNG